MSKVLKIIPYQRARISFYNWGAQETKVQVGMGFF